MTKLIKKLKFFIFKVIIIIIMSPPYKHHNSPYNKILFNGLNSLDCNSIILYKDQVWKFQYFGYSGTPNYHNGYYVMLNDDKTMSSIGEWLEPDIVRQCQRVILTN